MAWATLANIYFQEHYNILTTLPNSITNFMI